MTKYVSFCTTLGAYNAYKIMCQNTPRYTRREYKELLGILWAQAVTVIDNPGVYAVVYRCAEGKTPVPAFTVSIFTTQSLEMFPALTIEVLINGEVVRRIVLEE